MNSIDGPKRVYIAVCRCPKAHALASVIGIARSPARAYAFMVDPLRGKVRKAIAEGQINPTCHACKAPSGTWVYEVSATFELSDQGAEACEAYLRLHGMEQVMAVKRRA